MIFIQNILGTYFIELKKIIRKYKQGNKFILYCICVV